MKAVILAAGMGTRLGKYTKDLPKGMLNFSGRPLVKWQIDLFRKIGIEEIIIITGYKAETIAFPGTIKVHNPSFDSTNMVYSLMCAKDLLKGDILISYSDLLLSEDVAKTALKSVSEIGVVVDMEWKNYWKARYGRVDFDTEGLSLKENGEIKSLGCPNVSPDNIDARYVGLLKFSSEGIAKFKNAYEEIKSQNHEEKWRYSKNFSNAYMTDMIQEMIDRDVPVKSIQVNNGWLEFDTTDDYELACKWLEDKSLKRFITL